MHSTSIINLATDHQNNLTTDIYRAFHEDLATAVRCTQYDISYITRKIQQTLESRKFDIDKLLACVCDLDLVQESTVTCSLIVLNIYIKLGYWDKLDADTLYFLHKTCTDKSANGLIVDLDSPLVKRNQAVLWDCIRDLYN